MMKAWPLSIPDLPSCPETHLCAAQPGEEETTKSDHRHVHGEQGRLWARAGTHLTLLTFRTRNSHTAPLRFKEGKRGRPWVRSYLPMTPFPLERSHGVCGAAVHFCYTLTIRPAL